MLKFPILILNSVLGLTFPSHVLTESALAHVLCSADTVYGDVAGQMFVVQAIVDPAQFHFFQHLASQGTVGQCSFIFCLVFYDVVLCLNELCRSQVALQYPLL